MPASPNLSLPYIQPSQAQKHVTHNEGMRVLDALAQLSVVSASTQSPPAVPTSGMRYVVPDGATEAWTGHSRDVAMFEESEWVFLSARTGWVAWVQDANELIVFDGSDWIKAVNAPDFQNLAQVGIGTTANAGNPLAVAGPSTLLTHGGAGHQLKVNKSAQADTASLLFQTGWSGRAEMGTVGSDQFEIKVSDDGSSFRQAMVADGATGTVSFPSGVSGLAPAEFGADALLTRAYITAKADNLIANGTGFLGNSYNYPSVFVHDTTVTPNLPASARFDGYSSGLVSMEEFVAIDPSQVYRLGVYLRQASVPGDWSAFSYRERHKHYMGLNCFDADKNPIHAVHHMRYKHGGIDSLTTLAAPLSPGDTVISLTDASGWNESNSANFNRGILIFGYKNASGYVYSHYSRILGTDLFELADVDKTANEITLNKPLPAALGNPDHPAGTWPAGTPLANSSNGSTYKYAFFSSLHVPETDKWYRATGYIGGVDQSGTNAPLNFPPGTAYARPFWLPNYTNRSGGTTGYPDTGASHSVWFAGVSIRSEDLASKQLLTSGAAAGSYDIKVPVKDHTAGTISLVAATQSVSEV